MQINNNTLIYEPEDRISGLIIKMRLYDMQGNLIINVRANEIGNLGIYFYDFSSLVKKGDIYICIAHLKGEFADKRQWGTISFEAE